MSMWRDALFSFSLTVGRDAPLLHPLKDGVDAGFTGGGVC